MVSSDDRLIKTPFEKRKFGMNFTNALLDGDQISSIITVFSEKINGDNSDLVISSTGLNAAKTTVEMTISSGTLGESYRVVSRVKTTSNQELEGDGILWVRNK